MKPTRIALRKIYILLLGIACLGACEKDANFTVDDGDSKLRAFSEISPTEKIKVAVSTSIGVNSQDEFLFPKQSEALITLFREGKKLEKPGFRYILDEKAFISQGAFRPEPGVEYSLEVKMSENSHIKPIYATTFIPEMKSLENVEISGYKEVVKGNDKVFSVIAAIELTDLEHEFFIIKPLYDNGGENEYLKVNFVMQGNSGSRYSKEHNGLIVNTRKAKDNIQVSMSNETPISIDQEVSEISFEVQAITEDAYNYYKAHHAQLASQNAAVSEPVISFSNFENGLGLFTGYSSTILTFEIQ